MKGRNARLTMRRQVRVNRVGLANLFSSARLVESISAIDIRPLLENEDILCMERGITRVSSHGLFLNRLLA